MTMHTGVVFGLVIKLGAGAGVGALLRAAYTKSNVHKSQCWFNDHVYQAYNIGLHGYTDTSVLKSTCIHR